MPIFIIFYVLIIAFITTGPESSLLAIEGWQMYVLKRFLFGLTHKNAMT